MRRDVLFIDGNFVETRPAGAAFSYCELGGDGRSEVFRDMEIPGEVNGVFVEADFPDPRPEGDDEWPI